MTTSDLIFGLTFMTNKPFTECFSRTVCSIYWLTVWTCQHMSTACLLLLNIDKFISLSKPLHYLSWVTPRVIAKELSAALTISVVISFSTYFLNVHGQMGSYSGYHENPMTQCYLYIQPLYHNLKVLLCYILPTIISTCISFYIFWLARKRSTWVGVGYRHSSCRNSVKRKNSPKRVFFVFSSTVWVALTTLPYRLLYSTYYLYHATCTECRMDETVDQRLNLACKFFLCFLAFGTVGNPIVTILTQHHYRKCIVRLCRCRPIHSIRDRSSIRSTGTERIPLTPCGINEKSPGSFPTVT